jgi:hypothetical protein
VENRSQAQRNQRIGHDAETAAKGSHKHLKTKEVAVRHFFHPLGRIDIWRAAIGPIFRL